MKKKSIKSNYIYNMAYQLLIIILPIITTPYIARTLGPNGNGIYSFTISIVTYFILFGSLGISMYGQREIAYVQNDKEKRSKIFFELFVFRLITLSISMLPFYIFFARTGEYSIYYKILLLEMVANILDITWFYQGLEEFKKITIRNFIIKILSVLSIFIFIKNPNDISKYLFIYVISALIGSISIWLGLKKYIIKPKSINLKKHIKPMLTLFIPQVAIQIYVVLDKTMIGSILHDMNEVGYYEQSQKIVKILLTLVTAIGTVMMPRIANCYAEGSFEQIKRYMNKTFHFIFCLSIPLTFGLIAVANNFAPLFFGDGYDKVPILLQIMSFIIIFISISNVTGTQYLLSVRKQKQFTISVVVGAIVNFILNFFLISIFKSIGAAIATFVAELAVTLVQLFFIRKEYNIKDIMVISLKYLLAGLIMLLFCIVIDFIVSSKLLCLIIQIIMGALIYFLNLIILKDTFTREIIQNVNHYIMKILKKQ